MSTRPEMKQLRSFVSLCAVSIALICGSGAAIAAEAAKPAPKAGTTPYGLPQAERTKAWATLPDWSGAWQNASGYILDPSGAPPRGADGTRPGDRGKPPYKTAYEAKYKAVLDKAKTGKNMDPGVFCMPLGMPRLLAQPFAVEFIVTPEMTSIIWELDAQVRRIFTDGREHPTPDEIFPTWTGHSIGHWEGEVLVVDTIGLREPSTIDGAPDQTIDRTGAQLSGEAHIVERIRKVDANTIEIGVTITDKVALTKPWSFKRIFKRSPATEFVSDYIYCNSPIVSGKDKAHLPTTRDAYMKWLMNGPFADPSKKVENK